MQWFRNKLIRLLNKTGYDLIKASSHNVMSSQIDDVDKILYYSKINKLPYLCHVPLSLLRGHVMSFRFNPNNQPFAVAACKAKRRKGNNRLLIKGVLRQYYQAVQPQCAPEVLGVADRDAPGLAGEEPWLAIHPWEDRTIDDLKENRPVHTHRDNQSCGKNIGIEEGWHLFGPVSEEKLEVEAKRLEKLIRLIERRGFIIRRAERDNITAMVLINDKRECRWIVYNGQHRTAVLSALDYKEALVLVQKVVERKDVEMWQGVQKGYFTKEGALKVFDRVFYGKTCPVINEFREEADTQ